ncbi:uncharacterized protein MONOS_18559 [Monocercomonoides exilis]|uniref:uncharacterized protein n=1 Tax=Monocercomonoides exilis TaxID=2049356 RepID=UPI00355A585F|nr:hypothetical protein MONOS_18559 [Monocercomonoides exilis]
MFNSSFLNLTFRNKMTTLVQWKNACSNMEKQVDSLNASLQKSRANEATITSIMSLKQQINQLEKDLKRLSKGILNKDDSKDCTDKLNTLKDKLERFGQNTKVVVSNVSSSSSSSCKGSFMEEAYDLEQMLLHEEKSENARKEEGAFSEDAFNRFSIDEIERSSSTQKRRYKFPRFLCIGILMWLAYFCMLIGLILSGEADSSIKASRNK